MSNISVPKAKCRVMIGGNNIAAEFKTDDKDNSYVVKYKSIDVKGVGTLTLFVDYINREFNETSL